VLRIRRNELTDCLQRINWLTDWLTGWLTHWLTDWLTGSVVKRLWVRFPSSSTKPRFLFCVVPVYYYNHNSRILDSRRSSCRYFIIFIIRLKLPEQQPRRIRLPTQEETDFQTPDVPILHMTVWSWWNLKVVELTSFCTVLTWCQLDNFVVSWILTVIEEFLNSDLVIWSNF
jgi:hypothetical protein